MMLQVNPEIALRTVIVHTDSEAAMLRKFGVRSVVVVKGAQDVYRYNSSTREYELDESYRDLTEIVLALPLGCEQLRDDLAVRLGDTRCRWVQWPDGCAGIEETSDVLTAPEVVNMIDHARPMWIDEVCTMDDVPEPQAEQVFKTGFPKLDEHGIRLVKGAFMAVIGPYGPLPGSAQYHTRDGWKRLDEFEDGDEALVYDFETGATKYEVVGRVVASAPNGFIHLKNGGTGEITACDVHRWPVVGKLGAKRVLTTEQLAEAGRSGHGSGYSLIRTFEPPDNPDMPLSDDEIRLQVAVCADGSIRKRMANRRVSVCVRKDRKKERIVALLSACGKDYRIREYPERPTETYFDFDCNEDKRLSQFRNASRRQLRIVFDELEHWDGHVYDGSRLVLSTSDMEDAEFCEYLFSACGRRASVFVQNGNPERQKDNYLVCANSKGVQTRVKWNCIERVPSPDGKKYCLTTSTGFFVCRLAPGQVYVTGNSGKSVLLRQLAVNLWRLHGWRTLITSFEEKIKPRYQRDLRRHIIGKPIEWWTDIDIERADAEIRQAFRFLRRKRNTVLDADRFLDRLEYAVDVYGLDVVILDPINELDHCVPKGESKTDYMGRIIMKFKQLADDRGLLFIVAAHPPKDGVEKRLQKNSLLTVNDAADTAHFGNKADIGWAVWRELDGPTLLHVDKMKDHESMGKPTMAELVLDPSLNKFRETRIGYEILSSGDDHG